jgi:hypothetical protein
MKKLRGRFGLRGYAGIDSEVTGRFIDVLVQGSHDDPKW